MFVADRASSIDLDDLQATVVIGGSRAWTYGNTKTKCCIVQRAAAGVREDIVSRRGTINVDLAKPGTVEMKNVRGHACRIGGNRLRIVIGMIGPHIVSVTAVIGTNVDCGNFIGKATARTPVRRRHIAFGNAQVVGARRRMIGARDDGKCVTQTEIEVAFIGYISFNPTLAVELEGRLCASAPTRVQECAIVKCER